MSAPRLNPNYLDVPITAAFTGSTVFTLPKGAAAATLTLPKGKSAVELAVRPLTVGGVAVSIAGSEAGVGQWCMRLDGSHTAQEITFDAAHNDTGTLTALLTWWS